MSFPNSILGFLKKIMAQIKDKKLKKINLHYLTKNWTELKSVFIFILQSTKNKPTFDEKDLIHFFFLILLILF